LPNQKAGKIVEYKNFLLVDDIRGMSMEISRVKSEEDYSVVKLEHELVTGKRIRMSFGSVRPKGFIETNRSFVGILSGFSISNQFEQFLISPALYGPILSHGITILAQFVPIFVKDKKYQPSLEYLDDGCKPIEKKYLHMARNSFVVFRRGNCDFFTKTVHAQVARAAGVFILSDSDRSLFMTAPDQRLDVYEGVDLITIPSFFVRASNAEQLIHLKLGSITISYHDLIFPTVILPSMVTFHGRPIRIETVKLTEYPIGSTLTQNDFIDFRYTIRPNNRCLKAQCVI
jgi:hypothetical protein